MRIFCLHAFLYAFINLQIKELIYLSDTSHIMILGLPLPCHPKKWRECWSFLHHLMISDRSVLNSLQMYGFVKQAMVSFLFFFLCWWEWMSRISLVWLYQKSPLNPLTKSINNSLLVNIFCSASTILDYTLLFDGFRKFSWPWCVSLTAHLMI